MHLFSLYDVEKNRDHFVAIGGSALTFAASVSATTDISMEAEEDFGCFARAQPPSPSVLDVVTPAVIK